MAGLLAAVTTEPDPIPSCTTALSARQHGSRRDTALWGSGHGVSSCAPQGLEVNILMQGTRGTGWFGDRLRREGMFCTAQDRDGGSGIGKALYMGRDIIHLGNMKGESRQRGAHLPFCPAEVPAPGSWSSSVTAQSCGTTLLPAAPSLSQGWAAHFPPRAL